MAGVVLLGALTSANASVIYSFGGSITESEATGAAPDNLITSGDAITGQFSYDPVLTLETYETPQQAWYEPLLTAEFTNGTASWGSIFGIHDLSQGSGIGAYNSRSGSLEAADLPQGRHHDDQAAFLSIPDVISWTPPESYPASINLPDALDLDLFTGGEFNWNFLFPDFYENEGRLTISGTIDEITRVSVPEPGTLALVVAGLGLMRLVRACPGSASRA